jgi:hypothetical protein
MHVISGNMPFDDIDVFLFAYLTNQLPRSLGNVTVQNRLAVFGNPN